MKRIILFAIFIFIVKGIVLAQNRPFPQNLTYPYGYMPANVTSERAQSDYDRWRETHLVSCHGGLMPTVEPTNRSLVEAVGFAALLTAYYGDKEGFDGVFTFYKSKRTSTANNMMAWKVTCDGIEDQGSATDGDIDVAFGLLIAYWQWGGQYLDDAKGVIQTIKNSVLVSCNGVSALAGGYSNGAWGGCNETDISYYNPAFFRVFAEVTGDNAWDKLADDTYTILNNGANSSTGLVPDWQTVSGSPGPSGRCGYYRYDACRAPWRIALDYLWNGNSQAQQWCKKISDWAYNIGPANIKDGYNLDGSSNNDGNHNLAFTGSFAIAAMCNSQQMADDFAEEVMNMEDTYWFTFYLGCEYLLVLTGNFWKDGLATRNIDKNVQSDEIVQNPKVVVHNDLLNISGVKDIRLIEITNLSGQIIKAFNKDPANKNESLDISSFKNGFYILSVYNENGTVGNFKFIKL